VTRVVLVRHAQVTIDRSTPVAEWTLSGEGLAAAARLADDPWVRAADRLYSSPEPKAVATARALAGGRVVTEDPRLVELDRSGAGWVEDYEELVVEMLAEPQHSVRGCESMSAARARLADAVADLAGRSAGTIALVSHGLVLSLYVATLRSKPLTLERWRSIRLPDIAVVDPAAGAVIQDFGWL
jgi:broad specificity phosphatase PhoE